MTASARATRLHDRLLVRRIEAGAGGGEVRVPGTGKGRPWVSGEDLLILPEHEFLVVLV